MDGRAKAGQWRVLALVWLALVVDQKRSRPRIMPGVRAVAEAGRGLHGHDAMHMYTVY